jgi:hypothetical protein
MRYSARSAFSSEKLRQISENAEMDDSTRLQYNVSKSSQKAVPPDLAVTELFDNLAKPISPPHRHRHHSHDVLPPNSKQRAKVTEFDDRYYRPDCAENMVLQGDLKIEAAASRLILKPQAKVYRVNRLKCEGCGAEMKLTTLKTRVGMAI